MPLTDLQARKAAPREKDYKLADSGGLYLFVTKKGFKSWRLKYRFADKEKRLVFGPYPEVTLRQARRSNASPRNGTRGSARVGRRFRRRRALRRLTGAPLVSEHQVYSDADVGERHRLYVFPERIQRAARPPRMACHLLDHHERTSDFTETTR